MLEYEHAVGVQEDIVGDELVLTLPNGDFVILDAKAQAVWRALVQNGEARQMELAANSIVAITGLSKAEAVQEAQGVVFQLCHAGAAKPASKLDSTLDRPYKRVTRRAFIAGMAAAGLTLLNGHTALGAESASVATSVYSDTMLATREMRGGVQMWTDSTGRTVAVPKKPEHVAPYGPYAQSILESIDPSLIVNVSARGMHASAFDRNEGLVEELVRGAGDTKGLSPKALVELKPDLILDIATSEGRLCRDIDEQAAAEAIPVLHLVVAVGELPQAYRTVGELLARTDRCNRLADKVASIDVALAQARELSAHENRPRVYFGQGADGLNTRPAGTLLDAIFNMVGAENVAKRLDPKSCFNISPEQIMDWAPDFVCLSVPSYFESKANRDLLDSIWGTGFLPNEHKVLMAPVEPTPWFVASPLVMQTVGAAWLAHAIHSNVCSFDIVEFVRDFCRDFFHIELTSRAASSLLPAPPAPFNESFGE